MGLKCEQARKIDMVAFLSSLGIEPAYQRGSDYWYHSPLHGDKTPSFKINRRDNVWFDHGEGKGGDLITFGTIFLKCSVSELLSRLSTGNWVDLNDHYRKAAKMLPPRPKIEILSITSVTDKRLLQYATNRAIMPSMVHRHLQQAAFRLGARTHIALAFANDSGGYELRNSYFKGSSFPKDFTYYNDGTSERLCIFEGFFDMLSYMSSFSTPMTSESILVLNGTGMRIKALPVLNYFDKIEYYGNRDTGGNEVLSLFKQAHPHIIDRRALYAPFNDINEFICHRNRRQQQQRIHRKL